MPTVDAGFFLCCFGQLSMLTDFRIVYRVQYAGCGDWWRLHHIRRVFHFWMEMSGKSKGIAVSVFRKDGKDGGIRYLWQQKSRVNSGLTRLVCVFRFHHWMAEMKGFEPLIRVLARMLP